MTEERKPPFARPVVPDSLLAQEGECAVVIAAEIVRFFPFPVPEVGCALIGPFPVVSEKADPDCVVEGKAADLFIILLGQHDSHVHVGFFAVNLSLVPHPGS